MPDDLGVYQSDEALRVDKFQCFGGRTADGPSANAVVVGVFEGTRGGSRSKAHTVIPAEYAVEVAGQIMESAKEAMR